jgi:coenzyme F420-reducing hydrogenase gamma subunit
MSDQTSTAVRPRIAIFDFTSCEGCQLQIINLEEELVPLVGLVEIVQFREAMSERSDEYDIAIVEGSITHKSEIPRIEAIRKRAKILVARGAFAPRGGNNAHKNRFSATRAGEVYGDSDQGGHHPRSAALRCGQGDYEIPGCPITGRVLGCR